VDPIALLTELTSSNSLLTILSDTPDAKRDTPLNVEVKQEKTKVTEKSKNAVNKNRLLQRQHKLNLDLTNMFIT
jgi:hypothetical protein